MLYFDRFDICEAYNLFSILWGGDRQNYANRIGVRLHAIGFRAPPDAEYERGLSENGKLIYGKLVREREGRTVDYYRMVKRAKGRVSDADLRRLCGVPAPRFY